MTNFGWRCEGSVADWVLAEAYRFEFTQAIRLLEAARTEAHSVPLGLGSDPQRETLRLRTAVHFKFPPRELAEARRRPTDGTVELVANFFALAGGNAPLPDWVAELLLQQERNGDAALRDFLDIFHHRLLALLYRLRLHYRPWLDPALLTARTSTASTPETRFPSRAENAMSRRVLSFAGLGLEELRGRLGLKDEELLPYAGLLWHRPRSIRGLTRILEHAFGVPVAASEGIGVWRTLEPEDRTHLGSRPLTAGEPGMRRTMKDPGRNNELGHTVILGRRVWDAQGRFNLILGPLNWTELESFLPGQDCLHRLAALVRFYAGDLLDVGIELLLREGDAQSARLGTARLGWTAWVQPQRQRGERRVCFMLPEKSAATTAVTSGSRIIRSSSSTH